MKIISRIHGGLVVLALLTGCAAPSGNTALRPNAPDVATIVEAVQYAVDQAAKANPWHTTELEVEHWSKACDEVTARAAVACGPMQDAADELCTASCAAKGCTPIQLKRCDGLFSGQSYEGACKPNVKKDHGKWCTAAELCRPASKVAAALCKQSATLGVPLLKHAVLNLGVEQNDKAGVGISLFIVSLGSSKSATTASSIELTMLPRARSDAYKLTPPLSPDNLPAKRTVSKDAEALATNLTAMIVEAVEATVKEYVVEVKADKTKETKSVTPPMALSGLELNFAITLDESGKLGLKKEWLTPASLELGAEKGVKRTNTLKIVYARPAD